MARLRSKQETIEPVVIDPKALATLNAFDAFMDEYSKKVAIALGIPPGKIKKTSGATF